MKAFLLSRPPSMMAAAALTVSYLAAVAVPTLSLTVLRKVQGRPLTTSLFQAVGESNDVVRIHPSLAPIHAYTSETTQITLRKGQRLVAYCLSDLHADGTGDNWKWIQKRCLPPKGDDDTYNVLIVPGDMANAIPSLKRVFRFLASKWDAVCYCVGNHEAWVNENHEEDNEDEDVYAINFRTSVDQLVDVLEAAQNSGIYVGPLCINYQDEDDTEEKRLWMVPLQSFYHSSWDTEPEIDDPALTAAEQRRSFAKRWQDYRNMKWPTELTSQEEFVQGQDGRGGSWVLATAFGDLNENFLDYYAKEQANTDNDVDTTTISFSHYVPRIELSIEKRFLIHPSLIRVIGSNRLEQDVRRLEPDLHLFGHTHIPIAMECDGIRYAQWPLGYPREATLQCRTVAGTGPMVVFDSHQLGIPDALDAENSHWSKHYKVFGRDPSNLELAPWVRERLERVGRRRR